MDIVDRLESSFQIYIQTSAGVSVRTMRPLLAEAAAEIRTLRSRVKELEAQVDEFYPEPKGN